jgi:ABC-type antimicrobial peptide transport system permease subunit
MLFTRDFVLLVVVGFAVAAPVAYLLLARWLDAFPYRIDQGPGVFVLAFTLVLAVAVVTVGVQALRAAYADPARSLRYE